MKKIGRYQDKQNQFPAVRDSRSNPINDKMIKFGKSIRAKLSQKNELRTNRYSQPLYEEASMINSRQSENLESSKPILSSDVKMSVSCMFQNSDKDGNDLLLSASRNNLSKTKNVRFSDVDDTSSNSLSKSIKKGQSILKNSNSSDKLSSNSVNSHVASLSNGLSIKASLKDKGIDCQNKKYESTVKYLTIQNKKFFDDMFPPGGASLFHSKGLTQGRKDIRWMRFEDVYRGQKLILYNNEDRNTVKVGQFGDLRYLATCFNALGTSKRCLQRIFENQKYSKLGIYYLRLNHQGIWKYIIVDDYIPVKSVGKSYVPVFLSVCPPKSDYIQLWPHLLQKAIAKMYSTYESLFNESVENMMQQLTGVSCEKIALDVDLAQSNQLKIKSYLMTKDNILLCSDPRQNSPKDMKEKHYAICQNRKSNNTYFSQQTEIKLLNIDNDKQSTYLLLQNLHLYFKNVSLYKIDDSYYSVGCVIKQQKNMISLRMFKVSSFGNCCLSIIQKDKKYFRNNGYDYCWMRLILICKDLDGYRYINGAYSKNKIVTINATLSPGQYYILVNGDWGKKVYDVTLNYQANIQTEIKRQPIAKFPNIVSQMCRDMAQRFGKFVQVNKNICSYQYADRQNGLIIENFNNQMERQVYFHRIYKIPFKNFASVGSAKFIEDQTNANMKKIKTHQIQTFLQADANITLVLMLTEGIVSQEFSSFSFSDH